MRRAGDLDAAVECYERALAIVNFVRGGHPGDQEEVEANKVGGGVMAYRNRRCWQVHEHTILVGDVMSMIWVVIAWSAPQQHETAQVAVLHSTEIITTTVVQVAVLLNLAAVCLSQHRYGRAVQLCGEALQLQPSSVRARLRRAKAYMARKMYAVGVVSACTLWEGSCEGPICGRFLGWWATGVWVRTSPWEVACAACLVRRRQRQTSRRSLHTLGAQARSQSCLNT